MTIAVKMSMAGMGVEGGPAGFRWPVVVSRRRSLGHVATSATGGPSPQTLLHFLESVGQASGS